MLDVLRRPDITLYYAVQVQGISEGWVQPGCPADLFGIGTLREVIVPQSIAIQYPSLEPMRGLGRVGTLSLDLSDGSGYLAGLFGTGRITYLTATVGASDVSVSVADTTGWSASGAFWCQGKRFTYSGKTGTSFTGVVRDDYDLLDPPRQHSTSRISGPSIGAAPGGRVLVTERPDGLDSRWVIVRAAALDPQGYPIADDAGDTSWEVWRGIITRFPRAADGMSYRLTAETLERLIPEKAPACGPSGVLDVRNAAAVSKVIDSQADWVDYWSECEYFIPSTRRLITMGLGTLSGDTPFTGPAVETYGWLLTWELETAISDLLALRLGGLWSARLRYSPEDQVLRLTVSTLSWAADTGPYNLLLLPTPGSIWGQLGFLGQKESPAFCTNAAPVSFRWQADIAPASVALLESDPEIPIILSGMTPGAQDGGWARIGDEVARYTAIEWHTGSEPDAGPTVRAILSGCTRGFGGTLPQRYIYRATEDTDAPTVAPAWAVQDEPNIWRCIAKALCGTGGRESNLFDAGDFQWGYYTEPGCGMSALHFAGLDLYHLASADAILSPITAAPDDFRSWVSDTLGLSSYALVTRPGDDGKCLLRPTRIFGASESEAIASAVVDSTGGVQVQGGLSAIRNQVTLDDRRGNKGVYNDLDSQATHRITQGITFEAPVASVAAFTGILPVVYRIFELLGKSYAAIDAALMPVDVRFLSPGEVVSLTFPDPDHSGLWRILAASTPIRGAGQVKMTAIRVEQWKAYLYAPTCAVASVGGGGLQFTVGSGEGQWLRDGARVWVHDPDDWTDGVSIDIDGIDGDTVYCSDTTGIAAGYEVEFSGVASAAGDDRYLWLDEGLEWGD